MDTLPVPRPPTHRNRSPVDPLVFVGWAGVERWPEHGGRGRTGHNGREFHVTTGHKSDAFPTLTQKDWTGGMEPPGPYLDAQFLSYRCLLVCFNLLTYLCFQFPPGTFGYISIILAPQPIINHADLRQDPDRQDHHPRCRALGHH